MLPEAVKAACKSHELSDLEQLLEEGNPRDELVVVATANLLSNLCTEGLTDSLRARIQENACRALDLGEEGFLLLMGELLDLRGEVQQFLADL